MKHGARPISSPAVTKGVDQVESILTAVLAAEGCLGVWAQFGGNLPDATGIKHIHIVGRARKQSRDNKGAAGCGHQGARTRRKAGRSKLNHRYTAPTGCEGHLQACVAKRLYGDITGRQTGQGVIDGQIVNGNVPRRLVPATGLGRRETQLNGVACIGRNIRLHFLPAIALAALSCTDVRPGTAIGTNLHIEGANLGTKHVTPENHFRVAKGIQEDLRSSQRGARAVERRGLHVHIMAATCGMISGGACVVRGGCTRSSSPVVGLVEGRATGSRCRVAVPTGVNRRVLVEVTGA